MPISERAWICSPNTRFTALKTPSVAGHLHPYPVFSLHLSYPFLLRHFTARSRKTLPESSRAFLSGLIRELIFFHSNQFQKSISSNAPSPPAALISTPLSSSSSICFFAEAISDDWTMLTSKLTNSFVTGSPQITTCTHRLFFLPYFSRRYSPPSTTCTVMPSIIRYGMLFPCHTACSCINEFGNLKRAPTLFLFISASSRFHLSTKSRSNKYSPLFTSCSVHFLKSRLSMYFFPHLFFLTIKNTSLRIRYT